MGGKRALHRSSLGHVGGGGLRSGGDDGMGGKRALHRSSLGHLGRESKARGR